MSTRTSAPRIWTSGDIIGAVLAATPIVVLLLFPLLWGRAFARLFDDLGAAKLPLLTRVATSWWAPLTGAIGAGALLGASLRRGVRMGTRRWLVVGSFFVGAACMVALFVGLYLPLFALAGSIKAD
jgi:hypothetical protein